MILLKKKKVFDLLFKPYILVSKSKSQGQTFSIYFGSSCIHKFHTYQLLMLNEITVTEQQD